MDIRTPDFYDYRWAPLVSAVLEGDWVTVSWADGTRLRCYHAWLAENADGIGLEPRSRESMIDPAELPAPGTLQQAAVGPEGELLVVWPDVQGRLHPGWLRHVAEGQHTPAAPLPTPVRWQGKDLGEPPTIDGATVLEDPDVLRSWLRLLAEYGLARLVDTPADPEWLERFAARIGPVRDSNFGPLWSVRSVVDPNSTANTALALGQHTDLPTRETPPGFQFLHCIANTVAGGWSRMTDGLAVVDVLQSQHPEHYEALCTLDWIFFNRDVGADHRWSGPIIDHGAPNQPLTLRAFYPVRAFPNMAEADVPRAYAAMRMFSQVSRDPELALAYPFAPGDLVGFDNRRVLHGRDAFDDGVGERWLRGCYIDQDDLYSRLRVLTRTANNQPASTHTEGSTP